MIESFYRLFKGIRNYHHPLRLAYQRATGAPLVEVIDRRTGLRFICRRGADEMMAETFHSEIYTLPIAPLRTGDIVLDIGANHGFYACWAAAQGATVHAFEPDPNTFDLLVQNIKLNGLEGSVRPHRFAIAAETGDLQLFCTDHLGGGMSTIVPAFAVKSGMEVVSQANIKALSLQDALEYCQTGQVRVCKMDCEGAELAILSGMSASLRTQFDAFVMEYHPEAYNLSQLMDVLLSWDGYHVNKVVGRDPDTSNANLSIVKAKLLREWSGSGNLEPHRAPVNGSNARSKAAKV